MVEQQHLSLFLEIIAICMIIITVAIVFVAIEYVKTMHKVNTIIATGQEGLCSLSSNLSTITQKSSEVLEGLGVQTQFLALKASTSMTKFTNASLAFKAITQFFKKNPQTKEDNMNKDNLLSFIFGAAITGAGAYYAFKNKDEIANKIEDIEDAIADDYEDLVKKSKIKLEELTSVVQSTVQSFLHGGTADVVVEGELKLVLKKLDKLQKEIELFRVKH
jgi:predicted PurR-regulated permease PerM